MQLPKSATNLSSTSDWQPALHRAEGTSTVSDHLRTVKGLSRSHQDVRHGSCPHARAAHPGQPKRLLADGMRTPESLWLGVTAVARPLTMGRSAKQRRLRGGSAAPRAEARPPVLGLDVGGVLVDRVAEGSDTSFFGRQPMDTPAVAGALEAIPALVELFGHRVFIVSKAGPKIASLTRQWLGTRGAVGPAGIDPANAHFVRKRSDKHPVCDELGVTHFVDDRLDVLQHLTSVDRRYLFTGGLGENEPPRTSPDGVIVVSDWSRLVGLLMRDVRQDVGQSDRAVE